MLTLELAGGQAYVARHECFPRVVETDRHCSLEGVLDELGTVGIQQFDALQASDDVVLAERVVPRPPRFHHIGCVGPKVRVGVVSGKHNDINKR